MSGICMQQVADGAIIQVCRERHLHCSRTLHVSTNWHKEGFSRESTHEIKAQLSWSRMSQVDPRLFCFFFLLRPDVSSSHQQVSLARSPLLKNEGSNCEGLLLTSYDRTLVVKEICSEEVEEMHDILSEYHQVVHTLVGLRKSSHATDSVNPDPVLVLHADVKVYLKNKQTLL